MIMMQQIGMFVVLPAIVAYCGIVWRRHKRAVKAGRRVTPTLPPHFWRKLGAL